MVSKGFFRVLGERVHDVELPKWAKNDAKEFIRLHREALESKYVSEHLNDWIDLIFGYKQRGVDSVNAMNVFIHITYENEVDVDKITDPLIRMATISQINNFGQTPSMLFSKPHPKKIVPDVVKKISTLSSNNSSINNSAYNNNIDNLFNSSHNNSSASTKSLISANSENHVFNIESNALTWHSRMNPPLTVIGTQKLVLLNRVAYSQVNIVFLLEYNKIAS